MTVINSSAVSNSGVGGAVAARAAEEEAVAAALGADNSSSLAQHHQQDEEEEEQQQQQLLMQQVVDMSTGEVEPAEVDPANSLEGLVQQQHHQHGQQVVMMTTANGEQHQVVITEDGQLLNGQLMMQGGQETFVLHTGGGGKVEPEDLSFGGSGSSNNGHDDDVIRTSHHHIDLEAGAQAIQASAATAVQNVLRSLKESDKSILNQILPPHLLADVMTTSSPVGVSGGRQQHHSGNSVVVATSGGGGGLNHVSVLDDSLIGRPESSASGLVDDFADAGLAAYSSGGGGGSSSRRSRGSQESAASGQQPLRMQIAKQYSPWGFHYTLEAATAQWVRKEEDRCTYLNKGQFYGVTLEYRPSPTENLLAHLTEVKSVVVLVFRYLDPSGLNNCLPVISL